MKPITREGNLKIFFLFICGLSIGAKAELIVFSSLGYREQLKKMSTSNLAKEVGIQLSSLVGHCVKDEIKTGLIVVWSGLQLKSANLNDSMKYCHDHVGKYIDATNLLTHGTFDPAVKYQSTTQTMPSTITVPEGAAQ